MKVSGINKRGNVVLRTPIYNLWIGMYSPRDIAHATNEEVLLMELNS
ncbi:Uncharacterised protein [uncultured archaeon]|nr:Uncharacterised protein [uncultured archaeon]